MYELDPHHNSTRRLEYQDQCQLTNGKWRRFVILQNNWLKFHKITLHCRNSENTLIIYQDSQFG